MSFNWETEDESSEWDEKHTDSITPTPTEPNNRRRLLIVSILTALIVGLGYMGTNRFIQSQEVTIKQDVNSAYMLLEEAARERDNELLTFLLSATDQNWNREQIELLREGRLIDRSLPGYSLIDITPSNIELSPDFSEAFVTRNVTYQNSTTSQSITLAQTTIFRRGIDRWLFTIPHETYWGESQEIVGDQITLIYPAIDAPFAHDLHSYIEREVSKYCLATQACPGRNILTVSLESSPGWAGDLASPNLSLSGRHTARPVPSPSTLPLPSVTAFGQPLDDSSAEQIYAYYASHAISRISFEVVGRQLRKPKLIDWAIIATQLKNLGLPYVINPAGIDQNVIEYEPSYTWLWEYQANWTLSAVPVGNGEKLNVWSGQHHTLDLIQFIQFTNGNGVIWESDFQTSAGDAVTLQFWIEYLTGRSMNQLETVYASFLENKEAISTQ